MIRVADYIFQKLVEAGVTHVFTVPGGAAMHLNDAAGNTAGLKIIANLHEQASAIAAEGYARITGGIGCCMVTAGPGGTNAVTGVAGAFLDSTPVIFVSGQVKRGDLKGDKKVRQFGVQEIDIVNIVQPITKFAITITDLTQVRFIVEKAIFISNNGRKGPVWLDIPLDIQGSEIDPLEQIGYNELEETNSRKELSFEISKLGDLLKNAQRPIIIAGNGIRMASAVDQFKNLINQLGVPIQTTWLGMDLIEAEHPLYAQRPGGMAPRAANFALQNCDLLITIGARLDLGMVGYAYKNIARGAKKVIVDIDQSEIEKLDFTVDLPIVADAKFFIESLINSKISWTNEFKNNWLSKIKEWQIKYPLLEPSQYDLNDKLSAYNFSQTLSDLMEEDDIIAPGSSGFACEIFLLCYKHKKGQRMYHNRGTGSMGFGLPSSIGACIGSGLRRTICVEGDGGIQMNIQELETVINYNLPIKIFVVNNEGYASIRSSQEGYFGRKVAADKSSGLGIPDLSSLAKAYKFKTFKIDNPVTIKDDLKQILSTEGPTFCEVVVRPNEPRIPRLASFRKEDGSMVSRPLEDLFPFLERDVFNSEMIVDILKD